MLFLKKIENHCFIALGDCYKQLTTPNHWEPFRSAEMLQWIKANDNLNYQCRKLEIGEMSVLDGNMMIIIYYQFVVLYSDCIFIWFKYVHVKAFLNHQNFWDCQENSDSNFATATHLTMSRQRTKMGHRFNKSSLSHQKSLARRMGRRPEKCPERSKSCNREDIWRLWRLWFFILLKT